MAIIKTYPLKSNYYGGDKLVLSDMEPDDQGYISGDTKSITLSSLKDFLGSQVLTVSASTDVRYAGAFVSPSIGNVKVGIDISSLPNLSASSVNGTDKLIVNSNQENKKLRINELFETVGLATNSLINYSVKLPNSVGGPNQVLQLPSTIGTSPHQLEWSTPAGSGTVIGTGTAGRIPKWQSTTGLDNSEIFQSGSANIGIGTTTPAAKLDILDTVNQTSILVTNNNYNNYLIQKRRTDNTQILGIQEFGSGGLALVAGSSQRVNVNNSGNVGIGTASPTADGLEVANRASISGGNTELFITGNTSGRSVLGLGDGANKLVQHILADHTQNMMSFHTAATAVTNSERMRITSSGNVGIGTTAPGEKLEVTGKIKATGTADVLQLYRNSSSQANYIKFYDNATSSPEFYLGYTSNNRDFQISNLAGSGTIALRSGGGNTMILDSSQRVGIGTTAPNYKLDVNGELNAKGITSSTTHTVTIEATAGWYRLMQWGGTSRGGATVKLSTTGGNVAPTTYVINAYKTYGDPASTNTLKLEQYGNGAYITKARIATDSVTNVTYVEIYNTFTSANYTMEVYHDSLLGLDSLTTVLTGTLETGPNSVTQDELPFVYEGTTTEKSSSELVTLIGDGTNDGKLRFNCSANSHYVEIVGPTHSGGSSYSLKLPNSLPNVSAQILQSNASGVLGWIPTPSGGGGGGGGTITSVGLTMPSAFSVTGSPLSGTGGTISVSASGGSAGQYLDYQGNWSTPSAGTTSVTNGNPPASTGSALTISPNTGAVVVTSNTYAGTNKVGHVPAGGTASTFLRGDGTWVTPTNSLDFFKTIATPTNDVVASGNDDTLTLAAGSNTGIFINGQGSQVTIGLSAPTTLARGGVKLVNATQQSTAANGLTTTAGRTYAIQLNSSGQAVVNVPWSGGSGGGISFSGSTAGGLATYTNSSTAGVSSKVTLNANGVMQFDSDNPLGVNYSRASIDYNPTGNRMQLGDFTSNQGGIVEFYTNGNKQFQIGVNGEIGLGTGSSQGISGQVLMSQGNGSAPIWSVVSGGTTPGGSSGNIQYNNGSGAFVGSSSFSWELAGGATGVGKLVIGKPTSPQFQEGVIRLLGDGTSGGTGGTIELQAASGKSGGSANTFKIQAPTTVDTQTLILPEDMPTAEGDVLMIDTINNTTKEIQTKWDTAGGGQTYTAGTGISINSGNVISNSDLGSSQSIFKKVGADQGQSDVIASNNNDTLKIQGGTGISVTTTPASNIVTVSSTGTGSSNIGFQCYNMYEALEPVPKTSAGLVYVRMMVVPQDTSPVNRVSFFCTSLGNGPGTTNPGTVQVSVFRSSSLLPSITGNAVLMGSIDSNTMVQNAINTISFTYEGDPTSYTFSAGDRIAIVVAMYNSVKIAGSTVGLANEGMSRKYQGTFTSWPLPDQLEGLSNYLGDNGITSLNSEHAALTFWAT